MRRRFRMNAPRPSKRVESSPSEALLPFKILLIGNICAGKTTLGTSLSQLIGVPLVALDDLRRQYGDGSIAGDYLAYYHFLLACASDAQTILEFSGAGPHKHAVRLALQESTCRCAIIFVDTEDRK